MSEQNNPSKEKFEAPNWSYVVFSKTRFTKQAELARVQFTCLRKGGNAMTSQESGRLQTATGPWGPIWTFCVINEEPFKLNGVANWETVDPSKISGQLDPDGMIGGILKMLQGGSAIDPKAYQTGGFTQQRYKGSEAPTISFKFRVYSDQTFTKNNPPLIENYPGVVHATNPLAIAMLLQRLAVPRHTQGRGDTQLGTEINKIIEKFKQGFGTAAKDAAQDMFGGLFNIIKGFTSGDSAAKIAFQNEALKDPGNDILKIDIGSIYSGVFVMTSYDFTFSKDYMKLPKNSNGEFEGEVPLYIDFNISCKGYMLASKDEILFGGTASQGASDNDDTLKYPTGDGFNPFPYNFMKTGTIGDSDQFRVVASL